MSTLLRSLLFGLIAGVVLSLARAPLGLDLFSIPALAGIDLAAYRAFGMLAIAAALLGHRRRPAPVVSWACVGAVLGFALHAAYGGAWVEPGNTYAVALVLVVASLAMTAVRGRLRESAEEDPVRGRAVVGLGLVLAGAGVAVALESIARPLRLLGLATRGDDSLFGFAFLALLAVGAVAFRGLVDGPRRGPAVLAAGPALAAAACLYGVAVLGEFSSREGLDSYLRVSTWDLDTSYIGMVQGDLLIAGRTLLLPAFALGAALSGARRPRELARVLIGAAAGSIVLALVRGDVAGEEARLSLLASERVTLGATLAAVGGLVAILGAGRPPSAASVVGALACVGALILPRWLPASRAFPLSPWERFPPEPSLIVDTPEGLLTVETVSEGGEVLTLDRRRLTPADAGMAADEQRIRLAWGLLSDAARERGRVLLVGQLTPLRAASLAGLGAEQVDRTAAWHRSMSAVEDELFGDSTRPVRGAILDPREARRHLQRGDYDLVLVPPVDGSAPNVELGDWGDTVVCVWIGTAQHAAWRVWSPGVLPSSSGFDDLCIGLSNAPGATLPAGTPAPFGSELTRMWTRPFEREAAARAGVTRRLAEAARSTPLADLTAGLELHYAAQRRSSPWETHAQATEVDPEALRRLREAALSIADDPALQRFLHELWQGIASLLVGKRDIELIYEDLQPLAERFDPWPELERALAAADLEVLEPGHAAERLLKVVASSPYDLNLRAECADALAASGRPAEAAEQVRAALAIQPGRRDLERRLAAALVMAGDPEGVPMVTRLLREDPQDEQLEPYLGPGPWEPLPPAKPGRDAHEH